jgi:hypothetical protein
VAELLEFVRKIVLTRPEVPACHADPAANNFASLGAFRKADNQSIA